MAQIKETKEIIQSVTIGHKCDHCGKTELNESFPIDWIKFDSGYQGYGERVEEDYDACSPECFIKIIEGNLEFLAGREAATISGMQIEFAKKLVLMFNPRKDNI